MVRKFKCSFFNDGNEILHSLSKSKSSKSSRINLKVQAVAECPFYWLDLWTHKVENQYQIGLLNDYKKVCTSAWISTIAGHSEIRYLVLILTSFPLESVRKLGSFFMSWFVVPALILILALIFCYKVDVSTYPDFLWDKIFLTKHIGLDRSNSK